MGNGTTIGRVRGLGSAHHGAHHWLLQRFTAIGNLILMAYLLVSFLLLPGFNYVAVHAWLAKPVSATAIGLLVISLFWHARLGLSVVLEDYVHEAGSAFAAKAALNLLSFGGMVFGLLSIIRIALGAA